MNPRSYVAFARQKAGEPLPTAGRRATFSVEVMVNKLEFILESGRRRQESFPWVEKFCARFAETGSERPVDYPDTRNASYLIGLAREFRKGAGSSR